MTATKMSDETPMHDLKPGEYVVDEDDVWFKPTQDFIKVEGEIWWMKTWEFKEFCEREGVELK